MVAQPSQCGCDSGQCLIANPRDRIGRQRLYRAGLAQIKAMWSKARIAASPCAGQHEALVAAFRSGALGEERWQYLLLAVVSAARQIKKPALPDDKIVGRHFLHKGVLD